MPESSLSTYDVNTEIQTKNLPGRGAQLIAAYFDLTNLRWQMILGFGLACLAALTCQLLGPPAFVGTDRTYVAWAAETVSSADPLTRILEALSSGSPSRDPLTLLSMTADCMLWHQEASGYFVTNFLIYASLMALVALVMLELTGLSGNRSGSAGAIWAALLFAVAPYVSSDIFIVRSRESMFGELFLLAAIFCLLRYRLIRESWYRHLALICLILFLASIALAQPPEVTRIPIKITHSNRDSFLSTCSLVVYGTACLLFMVRCLKGWLTKEGLIIVACLAALALIPSLSTNIYMPQLLASSAIALSMLLPILALPIMDRIDQKNALTFSAIGTCVLVVTFLLWCTIFQVQSAWLRADAKSGSQTMIEP